MYGYHDIGVRRSWPGLDGGSIRGSGVQRGSPAFSTTKPGVCATQVKVRIRAQHKRIDPRRKMMIRDRLRRPGTGARFNFIGQHIEQKLLCQKPDLQTTRRACASSKGYVIGHW